MLATENRGSKTAPGPLRGRAAGDAKDRGALMFVGPSRTGKSVAVISGMLDWDGPMVAVSVKDDLLRPTLAHRRLWGEVAVFDPTGSLRDAHRAGDVPAGWDEGLLRSWSPLAGIVSFEDAIAAAVTLSEAAPQTVDGNKFWVESAEMLLAPMLWLAAKSGRPLGSVVQWVLERHGTDQTEDDATDFAVGELDGLFLRLRATADPVTLTELVHVQTVLEGQLRAHAKTLDSVYSTLQTIIKPWVSPTVASSAVGEPIDLAWLTNRSAGVNTVFLSARARDFKRLTPVYGGLVNDLLGQVYDHFTRHGPIDPPMLLVLDEAGNMPIERLPEFASLIAGMGVQLVTVWQDLAQIHTAYGKAADTILSNHLSKVFFGGISSMETLQYVGSLLGDEEVHSHAESNDKTAGRRSVNESAQRIAIAPTNVIRQMRAHEALLIHGSLKPAHISTFRFFEDRRLKKLAYPKHTEPLNPAPGLNIEEPLETPAAEGSLSDRIGL